jgi:hypothetical protein
VRLATALADKSRSRIGIAPTSVKTQAQRDKALQVALTASPLDMECEMYN